MSTTDRLVQDYFAAITVKDVNARLNFLAKNLPKKCTRKNYQLSRKLLRISSGINEKELQGHLQAASNRMREHLGIDRHIKILTIANVEAGKFEQIDNLHCIYVNGSLKHQNYSQKLAILAHEMSHYYLIYKHKLHIQDTNANELLTELNAIFTGFGFLLLDGYRTAEKREGNKIHSSRVGYVKLQTVREAIVRTAILRKQNPIWIIKNVGIQNIIYVSIGLYPLIKEYYARKWMKFKKARERK